MERKKNAISSRRRPGVLRARRDRARARALSRLVRSADRLACVVIESVTSSFVPETRARLNIIRRRTSTAILTGTSDVQHKPYDTRRSVVGIRIYTPHTYYTYTPWSPCGELSQPSVPVFRFVHERHDSRCVSTSENVVSGNFRTSSTVYRNVPSVTPCTRFRNPQFIFDFFSSVSHRNTAMFRVESLARFFVFVRSST